MCVRNRLTLCHSCAVGWCASSPPTGSTVLPPSSPCRPPLHQKQLSPPLLSVDTLHLQTNQLFALLSHKTPHMCTSVDWYFVKKRIVVALMLCCEALVNEKCSVYPICKAWNMSFTPDKHAKWEQRLFGRKTIVHLPDLWVFGDSSVLQSLTCLAGGLFSDWVNMLTGGISDAGAAGSEGGKGRKHTSNILPIM